VEIHLVKLLLTQASPIKYFFYPTSTPDLELPLSQEFFRIQFSLIDWKFHITQRMCDCTTI
ncbi:uncharacterized protein METZ01_LOCUS459081, partial [marine metagenome]